MTVARSSAPMAGSAAGHRLHRPLDRLAHRGPGPLGRAGKSRVRPSGRSTRPSSSASASASRSSTATRPGSARSRASASSATSRRARSRVRPRGPARRAPAAGPARPGEAASAGQLQRRHLTAGPGQQPGQVPHADQVARPPPGGRPSDHPVPLLAGASAPGRRGRADRRARPAAPDRQAPARRPRPRPRASSAAARSPVARGAAAPQRDREVGPADRGHRPVAEPGVRGDRALEVPDGGVQPAGGRARPGRAPARRSRSSDTATDGITGRSAYGRSSSYASAATRRVAERGGRLDHREHADQPGAGQRQRGEPAGGQPVRARAGPGSAGPPRRRAGPPWPGTRTRPAPASASRPPARPAPAARRRGPAASGW